MSKYKARKTEVDGIVFDSKREAERYKVLKQLQDEGKISNLELQVKYEIIPAQYKKEPVFGNNGNYIRMKDKLVERAVYYIADFVYLMNTDDGCVQCVEDTKGMRTKEYIIKRKMMLHRYGIRIQEV